jgi:Cytochrome c554 and c-prime
MTLRRFTTQFFWAALGVAACLGFTTSGCRKADVPSEVPVTPSVRLYFMSGVAGALEPCGCRKDMLGGVDHAAALLAAQTKDAPDRLLFATGPLLFQEPQLSAERKDQDVWKAEALAASLGDVGLQAWAPGTNDFADGISTLRRLSQAAHGGLLAANLPAAEGPFASTRLFNVGRYRVGVAGIGAAPENMPATEDAARALETAAQALTASGAQIRVALVAATRGDGLRLAERVPSFNVIALGKSVEQGDANDAAFPPVLVGDTLVVQAPNHLQAFAVVDLFVLGDDFSFADATGLEQAERLQSLDRRILELRRRLPSGQAGPGQAGSAAEPAQAATVRAELEKLEAQRAPLVARPEKAPAARGSFFRYALAEVREGAGTDTKVAARMLEYYRHVNEHNREAFKERKPEPPREGAAHYVGEATCKGCHADAADFWSKTKHASAYETLSSQFKEFNLDCVGCHVTGYNRPGGSTVTHVDALTNVQCEVCHGPGSRHAESTGNTDLITRKPAESVCRSCHHAPHVADDWDITQAWPKIVGVGHGQVAGN